MKRVTRILLSQIRYWGYTQGLCSCMPNKPATVLSCTNILNHNSGLISILQWFFQLANVRNQPNFFSMQTAWFWLLSCALPTKVVIHSSNCLDLLGSTRDITMDSTRTYPKDWPEARTILLIRTWKYDQIIPMVNDLHRSLIA